MRLFKLAVILALSLLTAPLAAQAQQAGTVPRIGFLSVRALFVVSLSMCAPQRVMCCGR